ATSVTVTVKTTCTAEAYDYTGMVQVVQQDMQTQATSYFSSDFVEVGTPHTTVVNAVTDARGGTLLAVRAVGRWAYRSSKGLKQSLAKSIAGLDVNHARTLLGNENGIAAVNDISIAGPNQHLLPADDSKITIVLRD